MPDPQVPAPGARSAAWGPWGAGRLCPPCEGEGQWLITGFMFPARFIAAETAKIGALSPELPGIEFQEHKLHRALRAEFDSSSVAYRDRWAVSLEMSL